MHTKILKPLLTKKNLNLGKVIGSMAYLLDFRYRRIVKRNLAFIYPDKSKVEIGYLAQKIYQQFALTLIELIKLVFLTKEDLLSVIHIVGAKHLEKAVQEKRGFIFFSAHIGNWEIAHLFTSVYLDMELVLVAKALSISRIDQFVNELRSKFGNRIFYKKGALSQMARALRKNRGVGLLIDQETRPKESVEVTLFKKKVNTTPSVAFLARRYDCPVLPVFCVREEKTGQLLLVVNPPLDLVKTRDPQGDIKVNTQKMNDEIERIIRAYPAQWFWFHKRWKRHYPHLYPEDMARNQRREIKKRAHLKRK